MKNVNEICNSDELKMILRKKIEERGEEWKPSYGQAFRAITDIIDDEILEGRIRQIYQAENNLNHEKYEFYRQKEQFKQDIKEFEERKKQLEGRGDIVTENAYKFAEKLGDILAKYPESVTNALSYAVYAYITKADLFKDLLTQDIPDFEFNRRRAKRI